MCRKQIQPEGAPEDEKKILSLLLSAALLCSVFGCAWAEQDKYRAFVDRYGPDYEEDFDWDLGYTKEAAYDRIQNIV